MKTRDIPRTEWLKFFNRFSRQHNGWIIDLEVFGADIGAQYEERELALEGITAEWDEGEGYIIAIMTGVDRTNHITHTINQPTTVNLEQTDEGANVALAIKAADGTTSLVKFRAVMLPEMVDAVASSSDFQKNFKPRRGWPGTATLQNCGFFEEVAFLS